MIALLVLGLLFAIYSVATVGLSFRIYRRIKTRAILNISKPKVSVVVPCKGLDPGLEDNAKAILGQDYPFFQTIFVVDNKEDPAFCVIEKVLAANRSGHAQLIMSSQSHHASGKIEALITGVKASDGEVYVFADSDTRPPRDWLNRLVEPLQQETVGASTGYRWYLPETGGFVSSLRSAWNAVGTDLLFSKKTVFVWGGSAAIRRGVFEELQVLDKWKGEISDDYVITKALRSSQYKIQFVPECVVPSIEDCTFNEFLEWTTRELRIVKTYGKPLWYLAVAANSYSTAMMLLGVILIMLSMFVQFSSFPAYLLLAGFPATLGRNIFRYATFRTLLSEWKEEFRKHRMFFLLAGFVVPWIVQYNLLRSMFGRRIVWRGKAYTLKAPL